MISVRFSGPVAAITTLRDAMRPIGAKRVSYKANYDGLTARLYVSFDAEA
ncbi:hypothetical protein OR1_03645 [Geobacter sp. OR-1]|nr:hypothetical protein [Geobacter sp. OR-1]GAM11332.1 hypothetical protein OR1_03645 [Geobacter sp. OR-1]